MKEYVGNDALLPRNERAFLQWENINYFVPTSVDTLM